MDKDKVCDREAYIKGTIDFYDECMDSMQKEHPRLASAIELLMWEYAEEDVREESIAIGEAIEDEYQSN